MALCVMSGVGVAIVPEQAVLAAVGVCFGAVLVALPFLVRRSARSSIQRTTEGEASETGIRLLPANATSEYAWTSFHQAKVLPDLVLLYRSSTDYHILSPGLFATDNEWQSFSSWVRSSVPRAHRSGTLPWLA